MISVSEISDRLAHQAEAVAKKLLPAGKREGREWCVGSVHGEEGKSLKVALSGEKAGIWADFASGQSGDLIDLWAAVRGCGIADVLKEAREYLGVAAPHFSASSQKQYRRPERPKVSRPRDAVLSYLHGRGLTDETLSAFKVAANSDDDEIVFPFLRGGDLINVKYLKIDRPGGKKVIRQESGAEPCLFGWQALPAHARSVVIAEGEVDAMTWWQMGFPALSVWSGADSLQWIETEWDRLANFDTIYLSFDRDEAGEKAVTQVVERLGRSRCRIVDTPYKDANECLRQGFDRLCFRDLIDNARSLDPKELRQASSYRDAVLQRFFPPEGASTGWETGFDKLTQANTYFDKSELIIINGINGHGKTSLATQLLLSIMRQGGKCCVASMEVKPEVLLQMMTKQACATATPSQPFIEHVQDYWDSRLWVFDVVGTVKAAYLLDVFRYARARYGITVFVIDSLTKCGMADDDYNAQKRFVDALCDFKNETDSTVFLVTHSRKLESEFKTVDKMDVKGSGTLTDLADTVTTLWRNKVKERDPVGKAEEPDAHWYWQKNRNGDFEGMVRLFYDQPCHQFRDWQGASSKPYVTFLRDTSEFVNKEMP